MGKTPMGFAAVNAKPLCRDTFIKISQAKTPLNMHLLSEIIPFSQKQSIISNKQGNPHPKTQRK